MDEREKREAVIIMIADLVAKEACWRDSENVIRELHAVLLDVGAVIGQLMRDCWCRQLKN